MQKYIKIDGTTYSGIRVLSVKRSFSVADGDNAGAAGRVRQDGA